MKKRTVKATLIMFVITATMIISTVVAMAGTSPRG